MPQDTHRRCPLAACCAVAVMLSLLTPGGPGRAQGRRVAADEATVQRLYQDVAFSLFVLTSGTFSSGGYANYEDSSTDAKFNLYNLPLRGRVDTGLVGPVELRFSLAYGEATTNALQSVPGV